MKGRRCEFRGADMDLGMIQEQLHPILKYFDIGKRQFATNDNIRILFSVDTVTIHPKFWSSFIFEKKINNFFSVIKYEGCSESKFRYFFLALEKTHYSPKFYLQIDSKSYFST